METKTAGLKCKVDGCKRPYRARDYCRIHYKKWRRGELPKSRYKTCRQEGCRKKISARGRCEEHLKSGAAPPQAIPVVPAAAPTPAPQKAPEPPPPPAAA